MKESNFRFEDLYIGLYVRNNLSQQLSKVIDLTKNSICIYNLANPKNKDKDGKLLGIESSNWYDLTWFNRKFCPITYEEIEDEFMNIYVNHRVIGISKTISDKVRQENFSHGLPVTYLDRTSNCIVSEFENGEKKIIQQL